MNVTMLPIDNMTFFSESLDEWADGVEANLISLFSEFVQQWHAGAIRRAPIRTLRLHGEFDGPNRVLIRIGAEIVIPLRYKGKLDGILTVGAKGNGEPFVQSDIDLLDALAGHAAVDIVRTPGSTRRRSGPTSPCRRARPDSPLSSSTLIQKALSQ